MKTAESYPGTLYICIDEVQDDVVSGRFYHRSCSEPIAFQNLIQMIMKADKLFDQIGEPMACVDLRSFKKTEKKSDRLGGKTLGRKELITDQTGEKSTFIVNVQYRQHASWQGKLTWAEGGKSACFRSVLELVKLMDSVVEGEDLQMNDAEDIFRVI